MRSARCEDTRRASDFEAGDDTGDDFVFDAAVKPFGVLANDDQIDVFKSRFDAGEIPHGANGGIKIEFLAQLDVDGFEAAPDGGGDGAFECDFVL